MIENLNVLITFLAVIIIFVIGIGIYKYIKAKPKDLNVATILENSISTLTELTRIANEMEAFKANDGLEAYKKTLADYVSNYIFDKISTDDSLSDINALQTLISAGVISRESLSLAINALYNKIDDLNNLIKEKYDEANEPDDEKHVPIDDETEKVESSAKSEETNPTAENETEE